MLHETGETIPPVCQNSREIGSGHGVDQSETRQNHEPPPGGPPGQFQDHHQRHEPPHKVQRRRGAGPADQRLVLGDQVEGAGHDPQDQGPSEKALQPESDPALRKVRPGPLPQLPCPHPQEP